jgi:hypothetical protein
MTISVMAKRHRPRDPFAEWREIQDHRYDPGHWLGGNIDPMYRRRRNGNPSGYLMIVGGALAMGAGTSALRGDAWNIAHGIVVLLAGVVLMIVGKRLLAKTPHDNL